MKTLLISCLIFCATTFSFGQSSKIDKIFAKFSGNEQITEVNISSKMFALFGYIDAETKEDKDVIDAIKGIKSLYLMSTDNPNLAKEMGDASRYVEKENFESLMVIKDGDENIEFLIEEKDGMVSELIMLVKGNSEFTVMSITGNIDLEKLSKLSNIGVDGLENLDKIDK